MRLDGNSLHSHGFQRMNSTRCQPRTFGMWNLPNWNRQGPPRASHPTPLDIFVLQILRNTVGERGVCRASVAPVRQEPHPPPNAMSNAKNIPGTASAQETIPRNNLKASERFVRYLNVVDPKFRRLGPIAMGRNANLERTVDGGSKRQCNSV